MALTIEYTSEVVGVRLYADRLPLLATKVDVSCKDNRLIEERLTATSDVAVYSVAEVLQALSVTNLVGVLVNLYEVNNSLLTELIVDSYVNLGSSCKNVTNDSSKVVTLYGNLSVEYGPLQPRFCCKSFSLF